MAPSTTPRRSLSLIRDRQGRGTKSPTVPVAPGFASARPDRVDRRVRERNPYSRSDRIPRVTASSDEQTRADETRTYDGPRSVLVLYALLTAVGGVAGVLVATFVDGLSAPALYTVIPLPATPLGFAVYGAATIATVLGVPLALVIYVSQRIDDPHAVEE